MLRTRAPRRATALLALASALVLSGSFSQVVALFSVHDASCSWGLAAAALVVVRGAGPMEEDSGAGLSRDPGTVRLLLVLAVAADRACPTGFPL